MHDTYRETQPIKASKMDINFNLKDIKFGTDEGTFCRGVNLYEKQKVTRM